MTREQLEARAAIATYEGHLTDEQDDRYMVFRTDYGRIYRVDPYASHIMQWDFNEEGKVCGSRRLDLCELESRISHPQDFEPGPYDLPPADDLLYPPIRPCRDEDSERMEALQKEDRDMRLMEAELRRREAA